MPILDKIIKYKISYAKTKKQKIIDAGYIPDNENYIYIPQDKIYQFIPTSQAIKLDCICDHCNKEFSITCEKLRRSQGKSTALKERKDYQDDLILCRGCRSKSTNQLKYGCNNPSQNKEVQKKRNQTNLKRYGYIHAIHNDKVRAKILKKLRNKSQEEKQQIKDKVKQTTLQRYGVEYVTQSKEIQKKIKQTNLKKYGTEYASSTIQVKEKILNTIKTRYGYQYTSTAQIPEIRAKQVETLRKNGKDILTSKQQKYFHQIFGGELNYQFQHFFLDIAFLDEKIDIEYNGGGHDLVVKLGVKTRQQFNKMTFARYQSLINNNWKIITLISPHDRIKQYSNQQYIELIQICKDYLNNTQHHWVEIYIEEDKIKTSLFIDKISNVIGKE